MTRLDRQPHARLLQAQAPISTPNKTNKAADREAAVDREVSELLVDLVAPAADEVACRLCLSVRVVSRTVVDRKRRNRKNRMPAVQQKTRARRAGRRAKAAQPAGYSVGYASGSQRGITGAPPGFQIGRVGMRARRPLPMATLRDRARFADSCGPRSGRHIIASDDQQALDDFESLIKTLGSRSFTGDREFTVFYLKYAEDADRGRVARLDLWRRLVDSSGRGGSLLGDIALRLAAATAAV